MNFIHQPATANRIGDHLKTNLSGSWTHFRAAIAFVKRSGTKHITSELSSFCKTRSVEIIVGVDHQGTSAEGLSDLMEAVAPSGKIIVFHNRLRLTFHPKLYLFKNDDAAEVIIGSGNMTEGGLFTNYEASAGLSLDLVCSQDAAILNSIENALDAWADPASGTALVLNPSLLTQLIALGLVPLEALAAPETGDAPSSGAGATPASIDAGATEESDEEQANLLPFPFAARSEPRAPHVPKPGGNPSEKSPPAPTVGTGGAPSSHTVPSHGGAARGFVITLQQTDVGVGQTSAGAQRRSPELFIPIAARNANPDFWGWPVDFVPDPSWSGPTDREGYGKMDRANVRIRLGAETVTASIWYNPNKRDVRIRSEALRSAGNINDILRIEKAPDGAGFDYYAEIVPQGTTQYPVYRALCATPVRNSPKMFGYY